MKRFMQLSIGVLCLMLAVVAGYHLGSQTAQAQAPEMITGFGTTPSPIVSAGAYFHVMLSNGDIYRNSSNILGGDPNIIIRQAPTYVGNFWYDAPVPTNNSTWGGVKSQLDGNN